MSVWSLPAVAALVVGAAFPPGMATLTAQDVEMVRDPAALVNVFHGTKEAAADFGHGGGGGMTFPGAVLPFGMMQWSPDTVADAGGGYRYEDDRLRGFSMTHLSGAGCTGAQDFPVMPFSGAIGRSPATHGEDYVQTFKHANETASPGFYSSTLDTGIRTELSVSARAGVARFTFPQGKPGTVLLNTSGSINGVDDGETRIRGNTVEGWVQTGGFCGPPMRYKVYFHATFDQPVTASGTWKDDEVRPGALTVANAGRARVRGDVVTQDDVVVNGPGSGAYLQFDPARPVQMRVGLSYVSVEGAARNLAAEIAGKSLDQVRAEAAAVWDKRLGQVRVGGGTDAQRRAFYSNLYHTLLQPYVFEDVDGTYTGMDGKPHTVPAGRHHYATFSGWDIYRSEVQLLALLAPDVAGDIAQSMYDNAQAVGNVWDRWSHQTAITGVMVGDPYHVILSTMYAFGARGFDYSSAFKAMVEAARRTGPKDIGHPLLGYDERPGNAAYMSTGYVPSDPSATLEYGAADFGIAQLATRLGDRATAGEFMKRAQAAWQSLYNPGEDWIQPRMGEGSFKAPFDPGAPDVYMEGNGAQYHWMVPYNPQGLITAMGGAAKAGARLDAYFKELNAGPAQPYAYLGNEPGLASPWLYAWLGKPYKTQEVVRRAQKELFGPGPDGLVGNDDLGAMGSWYVWSAIGLYPAIPGRAELLVSTPLFDRITIARPAGDITVSAPGAAGGYVRALQVNGVATTKAWLPESFATAGGRLDVTVGTSASTTFGAAAADAPPSFKDGSRPYLAGAAPGSGPVEPGGVFKAELAVRSLGSAATVAWQARPPAGVTVSPASGTLNVAAAGQARVALTVTVSSSLAPGFRTVPITVGDTAASVRLNVARRGTPEWHHNNAGIGDDASQGEANLDGTGFSYSPQGLANAGLRPGEPVTWKDFRFTWPARKKGEWDNIRPDARPLEVAAPAGASRIAFLGSGTLGDPQSKVTITYTDGTTSTATLGFSDWILDWNHDQPGFGNEIVATTPYRLYWGSWALHPINAYVYASQPIALDPAKQVRSLTFGPVDEGQMHIFTWAFA
ncbi:GH92 family glycosyl hydrolase [Nonomuraea sp. NPDC050783]|uniref:GH92 family glycosyl hydrolase n=1 Tax=Nonomuraea sp. NPDC050783 TaxID=3154634 RepID=UPI00346504F5